MARQRQSFSTEFKKEAASLVLDQGYSLAEASRSLDVGSNNRSLDSRRSRSYELRKILT